MTINVAYSSVEELTLRTGGQDDVVNVESAPSAGALIQTGAGDDVVNASPTAANIETVNGLQVDGGHGHRRAPRPRREQSVRTARRRRLHDHA